MDGVDPEDPRFGQEDQPYIEQPDEKDDDVRNGLLCFLDKQRECGTDCMAYLQYVPENVNDKGEPRFEISEQGLNCSLLVNMERVGKHLIVLAGMTHQLLQLQKKDKADRTRQQPSIPNPSGS